ncbi:MAG: Wzz/FepE/Etk N-terminal domain-containing protein [Mariprofundaceae bacterium]|nr:Wzz/FepE/Etk N-terminal domain-containing protein [Mariprofundaceae bacterium]
MNDEVSLIDIWRVLVAQKKIIYTITLITLLLGVGYAFLAPKVYKAEAYLLPPLAKQIQGIKGIQGIQGIKGIKGIQGITVTSVYAQFLTNLKSRDLRRKIFQSSHVLEHIYPKQNSTINQNDVFENFNKTLKIWFDTKNKKLLMVYFEANDGEFAAGIVNDFIVQAANKTVADLFENVASQIDNMKKDMQNTIKSKRSLAKKNRLDRIATLLEKDAVAIKNISSDIALAKHRVNVLDADKAMQLKEAITLAKSLGIIDEGQGYRSKSGATNISVSTTSDPLYLRGSKVLQAELDALLSRKDKDAFTPGLRSLENKLLQLKVNEEVEILKNRKNDDAFIPGLRPLQERLIVLDGIKIILNKDKVFATRVDQKAVIPNKPIKPKKVLIVMLSLLLGLMLGVMVVFLRNAVCVSNKLRS